MSEFRTGWLCVRCRDRLHGEHPAPCPCSDDPVMVRVRIAMPPEKKKGRRA